MKQFTVSESFRDAIRSTRPRNTRRADAGAHSLKGSSHTVWRFPSRNCDLFVTPAAPEVPLLNGDGATAGVEPSWPDDGPAQHQCVAELLFILTSDTPPLSRAACGGHYSSKSFRGNTS